MQQHRSDRHSRRDVLQLDCQRAGGPGRHGGQDGERIVPVAVELVAAEEALRAAGGRAELAAEGQLQAGVFEAREVAVELVTAAPFDPTPQHGLQRIEVDTLARTFALKALLPAPGDPTTYPSLWDDRSLQVGSKLVYLTAGQVVVADW